MRLLDPCCRTGAALRQIADAVGGETYGVEIARDRADEAQAVHSVGVHAYHCRPDVAQLEEDASAAVRRGRLTVPDEEELTEAA